MTEQPQPNSKLREMREKARGMFKCISCDGSGRVMATWNSENPGGCPVCKGLGVRPMTMDELQAFVSSIQEEARQQIEEHTQHVSRFLNDMYATMIDPLAEGEMKVAEICAALLKAATEQRQQIYDHEKQLAEARAQIDAHVCDVWDAGALKESIAKARQQAFREAAPWLQHKPTCEHRIRYDGTCPPCTCGLAAALERAAEDRGRQQPCEHIAIKGNRCELCGAPVIFVKEFAGKDAMNSQSVGGLLGSAVATSSPASTYPLTPLSMEEANAQISNLAGRLRDKTAECQCLAIDAGEARGLLKRAREQLAEVSEIHNRFCGENGEPCQVCKLKAEREEKK